ncbi:hypothetical protein [Oryza sativa Japonica Group]|uniref:Os01g0152200 protein n=3 Tax=Oryza TaxID=4527 RepID=A2ZPC4_ORYSJ|nr:hypothetical protein OsJ_00403 [Oryza sativa Japonica Group]USI00505.1 F-box domain-containing protein [Oryza sativa Japonica Group]BAB03623.1 hypothetical protein [Oryza sativa Japonica Group]BAB44044.1 hypothetical protein [Oryza sativa Japonica Group]BAS70437.1 Os01g0152200 [Oryza sativa Japonica Group]
MADNDIMAALPEDVLLQVLSRVGNVKSLFMLAATCRRFTDRAFLRDLWGGQRAGDLLGFFFHRQRNSASTFGFLPAPPLRPHPLQLRRRAPDGAPRHPPDAAFPLQRLVRGDQPPPRPLQPYHQRAPRSPASEGPLQPWFLRRHQLRHHLLRRPRREAAAAIFRPLHVLAAARHHQAQEHQDRVPPLVLRHAQQLGRARRVPGSPPLLPGGRGIIVIRRRPPRRGALAVHRPRRERHPRRLPVQELSVEVGGTATATPRVSMTKLPVLDGGTPTPLLCVGGDGELTIVCVFIMHVRVWKQQRRGDGDGDGAAAWRRDVIWMPTEVSNYPKSYTMAHGLGRRGSVAMMYSSTGAVFVLDLDKKVMEKAMDCLLPLRMDHSLDRPPVPYEMDLVEFFLLQLGGLWLYAAEVIYRIIN